jgi:hypothetical protein
VRISSRRHCYGLGGTSTTSDTTQNPATLALHSRASRRDRPSPRDPLAAGPGDHRRHRHRRDTGRPHRATSDDARGAGPSELSAHSIARFFTNSSMVSRRSRRPRAFWVYRPARPSPRTLRSACFARDTHRYQPRVGCNARAPIPGRRRRRLTKPTPSARAAVASGSVLLGHS